MSFFVELGIDGADGEVDLAAFLNLEDLLSDTLGENLLNLRIGTVGMQEMDLPNTRGHQLFTRYGYLKNEYMVPYPAGFSEQNDFMMHPQVGLMLYGFGSRWWGAVGFVNGQGGIDDVNSEKDVFVQLNFKIGGLGFDASAPAGADEESDEIPTTPSGHWVDNSLRFGFFGYYGLADVVDPLGFAKGDSFWRLGADMRWKIGDVSLAGGVVTGDNDRPYATVLEDNVAATTWFAEGEWFVYPWLIATVRYESLSVNSPDGIFSNDFDRARFVPGFTIVYRANIRIVIEGLFYATNKPRTDTLGGELADDNVVGVRLDVAF